MAHQETLSLNPSSVLRPPSSVNCKRNTEYRIQNTEKGFTLLEVLIATIIFTVGVIAIMWAFSSGMLASTDVENVDLALNIAQGKMEEIKNTPFASLSDSGPTPDPNFPNFNVTVNVAEGQNPMQVDVTVSWSLKGGQTSVALTTLIANY